MFITPSDKRSLGLTKIPQRTLTRKPPIEPTGIQEIAQAVGLIQINIHKLVGSNQTLTKLQQARILRPPDTTDEHKGLKKLGDSKNGSGFRTLFTEKSSLIDDVTESYEGFRQSIYILKVKWRRRQT